MSIEIPGYKIMRAIGRGGMATVYLAEQEIFEREVALKVMSKSLAEDPSFGQRFFREARIVSQLVHPNIVTVHDVGEHDGHFYLSMEYIDGGDLKHARKRLTFRQKINAVKDIAKALQYAATKGYVHRDIKPENIMFHLSDGRAVLTDFGIARAAEAELSVTQTGVAIGTPHYMSPEQAKGKPVDGRADIYSLGVVLYRLLSGKVPFDGESAVAIGIKHITDPIPLLPVALNQMQPLIDKMMAKSPEQRFQSAAFLISALDNLDMARLERFALDYDRSLREHEGEADIGSETPTLVSAPIKSGSRLPTTSIPPRRPAVSRTAPTASKEKSRKSDATGLIQKTEINELPPSDASKEPFTVIYEGDELADQGAGGFSLGSWLLGVLVVAAFGAGIYFYLNPSDWKSALEQGSQVYLQAKSQVQELVDQQGLTAPEASDSVLEPKSARPSENASELSESRTVADLAVVESQVESVDDMQPVLEGERVSEGDHSTEVVTAVDAEAGPSEEELLTLALEERRNRIATLEDAFLNDAAFLPDLVEAHRELLALVPEDVESREKLAVLKAAEKEKISQLLNEKKFSSAEKKLAQLKILFLDTDKKEFDEISGLIAKQEKLESLLVRADMLFASGKMLVPEADNALATYKQALSLDSRNTHASQGVRKISDFLLRQASEAFAREDVPAAEEKVKAALEVDWKNAPAEKLLEDIRNLQENLAKRDVLYRQAEQALNSEQYFEPVKDNAYHFYAQVLEQAPEDPRALRGVDTIMEGFSAWVWALVGENKFDEAERALVTPLNILPREERLQSLKKAVKAVIAERTFKSRPVVTKLLVSGNELDDLNGTQQESIAVGRSIFVILGYENLSAETTTIEARLLDGAGNIEVAKQAVNVVNGSNVTKFKFDSPVGSFPSGLYNLVLSINDTVLNSSVFSLE